MPGKNLLRKALMSFKPYITGKPIDEVRRKYGLTGRIAKLASNENPLGVSPMALEAMQSALKHVWLYPDDSSYHFRSKIAETNGVEIDNVIAGAGSVEIIEQAAMAFLNPDDNIVTSERSFAIYSLVAHKAGVELRLARMCEGGYKYNLKTIPELIDEKTKIIFLANPTNPTGTWFEKAEFDAFMAEVPEDVLVVYDSAYQEYITADNMPDPMAHFRDGRRIMILRTFSKAYGLAGMRIGYGIAPEDIIAGLMTCRLPFNANLVAQAGAMAAMDDIEFVKRSREHNSVELEFLREGLKDLPVTVPPSQTNFVMIDTKKDAEWLFEELQKVGVIVRPQGGGAMPNAIRVNTGLREDNERFLEHFRRLILA